MPDEIPLTAGETMHIYTDGASRGNPGEAACACIFATNTDDIFHKDWNYLGDQTNNYAEYKGIILALDNAVGINRGPIVLHSDSKLVINQINGNYRIKSDNLKPLFDETTRLKQRYDELELRYVPRENALLKEADKHCSERLNQKLGLG
jgi:ribonuclease HI